MTTARNTPNPAEFVRHLCVSIGGDVVAGIARDHAIGVSLPTMQVIGDFSIFEGTDSRVTISTVANCIVIGRWNGGITCFRLTDGSELWHNDSLRDITRVNICERDRTVHVESHRHVTIFILDIRTGRMMEKLAWCIQLFSHPKESIDVCLTFDLKLELRRSCRKTRSLGKWCTFAIHDVCFAGDSIVVAGPQGCLGSYSISSAKTIAVASHEGLFSRCGALAFDPVSGSISALAFDYGPNETYALLRLDTALALSKPIREYKRVFDAAFCLNGSHLINTDGELIDARSGDIISSTDWGLSEK